MTPSPNAETAALVSLPAEMYLMSEQDDRGSADESSKTKSSRTGPPSSTTSTQTYLPLFFPPRPLSQEVQRSVSPFPSFLAGSAQSSVSQNILTVPSGTGTYPVRQTRGRSPSQSRSRSQNRWLDRSSTKVGRSGGTGIQGTRVRCMLWAAGRWAGVRRDSGGRR